MNRKALIAELEVLKPIFTSKESYKYYDYVVCKDGELFATNGLLRGKTKTSLQGNFNFNAHLLLKFLNKVTAEEVTFVYGENVEVRAGRNKITLASVESIVDFNIDVVYQSVDSPGLSFVIQGCSNYTLKNSASMQYISVQKDSVSASNSMQIVIYRRENPAEFYVHTALAKCLTTEITGVYVDDMSITLKTKNGEFSCMNPSVPIRDYPETVKNFELNRISKEPFEDEFKNGLDVIAMVTTDTMADDRKCTVTISDGVLEVRSKGISGNADVSTDIDVEVEVSFKINPVTFKNVTKWATELWVGDGVLLAKNDVMDIYMRVE